jgi:hypothetical protein
MPSPHPAASESGVHATGPKRSYPALRVDKWSCTAQALLALVAAKLAVLLPALLGGWGLEQLALRWDGARFINAALHGYREPGDASIPPLYPLLVRGLAGAGLPGWASGLLVSSLASLALVLLLCMLYGRPGMLAVILFPTIALYTTLPYSEALAVPLAAGGLLAVRRGRWGAAALLLGLAGLARYQVAVGTVALALWALYSRERRGALLLTAAAAATAGAALLVGYMFYGDPLAYLHSEAEWDARVGIPLYSQAEWLLHSWFTGEEWLLLGHRIEPWEWLARNLAFYALYIMGALELALKGLGAEALWSLSMLAFVAGLTGVPAVSAPRLLDLAFPAIAGIALRWRPGVGYAAIAWILTLWATVWHYTSFFA